MTPRVAVSICSGDWARYAIFYGSLFHVRGVTCENIFQSRGPDANANAIANTEKALQAGFTHLWMVDDDQVFTADTLEKLLARDVEIVSGLYVQREPPFTPHIYDETERGLFLPRLLKRGDQGLVGPLGAVGGGCLLIRLSVFEAIGRPYWQFGENGLDPLSPDLEFCRRARAAGFSVWCDLDVPCGHMMQAGLWPNRDQDGEWFTVMMHTKGRIAAWTAAAIETGDASGDGDGGGNAR